MNKFTIERAQVAHIIEGMNDAKAVAKETLGINIDHVTVAMLEEAINKGDFVIANVFDKESSRGDKAGNGSINIGLFNLGFTVSGVIVNCRLAINQDTCGRFQKKWADFKSAKGINWNDEQRVVAHEFNMGFFKQHKTVYLAQKTLVKPSKTNGAKITKFEPLKHSK